MDQNNSSRSIRLLPPELRDQIAAGEVVERPASVIKELLENSLDAGADEIDIKIEDGGQSYISVRDNGVGIRPDELVMAISSHATSKVQSFKELLRVASYGFRGEALPSIASVARVKIVSSRKDESNANERNSLEATGIEVEFGKVSEIFPAPSVEGTLIEVRDLFSNVPARLKFLKTNSTEQKRCQEVVARAALAHPEIGFTFSAGGREIYRFNKGMPLIKRLEVLWPPMATETLTPFELVRENLAICGVAGHPSAAQPRADRMLFYVNDRVVNDKILLRAAREAYKGRLLGKEYPQVVLFLQVDPEEVDVNVHPAKSEVRFRDERAIFSIVMRGVEAALASFELTGSGYIEEKLIRRGVEPASEEEQLALNLPEASASLIKPLAGVTRPDGFWGSLDKPRIVDFAPPQDALSEDNSFSASTERFSSGAIPSDTAIFSSNLAESAVNYESGSSLSSLPHAVGLSESSDADSSLPLAPSNHRKENLAFANEETDLGSGYTYLGQFAETYLIVRYRDNLLMLDQHAVHERILVNKIKNEIMQGHSQLLALPIELKLHRSEEEQLELTWGSLNQIGFSLNHSVNGTLVVKGVPVVFDRSEAQDFLRDILACKDGGLEHLIATMACKRAIKARRKFSHDEILSLLNKWLLAENREFCPHGRPSVISFTQSDLDKLFKRRG